LSSYDGSISRRVIRILKYKMIYHNLVEFCIRFFTSEGELILILDSDCCSCPFFLN
jgi:hypothetical protein